MKIICAPDSFKESISAADAARSMAAGVKRADPRAEVDVCPVADGGEGTLEALVEARGGIAHEASVTGPLGEPIQAHFAVLEGDIGIVELADASGLANLPKDRRDPTRTTTFGTGELIRLAVGHGCGEVIVCIGGSATVDGGAGMAQALGARFFGRGGRLVKQPMTGGLLREIGRIEPPDERLPRIRIACDVTNPLIGERGAAAMYGPQKGATSDQVKELDAGLAHLAALLGADPATPGFGAAGGAALSLVTLCGAVMERGIELVLDAINFHERCRGATLVLTGEGRLDGQSMHGKAPIGVALAAARLDVPTIAIVGSTGPGVEETLKPRGPLERCVSLSERYGLKRAMIETVALIERAAYDVAAHMFSV
jgi:glycerate 2-kinase